MNKEHRCECARCGAPEAEYCEELHNPFCGPCKEDILVDKTPYDCDCEDCLESGEPCGRDCDDPDTMCEGCRKAKYNRDPFYAECW